MLDQSEGMSPPAKRSKRCIYVASDEKDKDKRKEEVDRKKAEITADEKSEQPTGEWKKWTPTKLQDKIRELNLEFEEYYFEGFPTCYLRCARIDGAKCKKCRGEPFHTYDQNTDVYKKTLEPIVDRHAQAPDEQRVLALLNNTKDHRVDVQKKVLQVMRDTGTSFRFWSHDSVKALMRCLLKNVSFSQMLINQLCLSKDAIKIYMKEEAKKIRERLQQILPEMAKKGRLSISLDHKYVKTKENTLWKILGVEVNIRCKNGFWNCLIGYVPMPDSTADHTIEKLKQIFEEYNLTDAIEKNLVCIVSDQAAESVPEHFTINRSICGSHSMCCNLKRACEQNLRPGGPKDKKYESLEKFIDKCEATVSASDLPAGVGYKSINAFLISQEVTNRLLIKEFYNAKIKASTEILEDDQVKRLVEEKTDAFLNRKEKGKAIDRISGSTRFRKLIYGVQRLLLSEDSLNNLFSINHPQRHLLAECPVPDLQFARSINPLLIEIHRSINILESDSLACGSAYYKQIERIMIECVNRITISRTEESRFAKAVLISVVEQVTKKRIDMNGNDVPCQVPLRFTNKDLASIYLAPDSTSIAMNFHPVVAKMKDSRVPFISKIMKVLVDGTKDWLEKAKNWITEVDRTMEDDELTDEQLLQLLEAGVNNVQCDSQNNAVGPLSHRRGLGKPKEIRSKIEEEIAQYDEVNDTDIEAHKKYCAMKKVVEDDIVGEFWRRYAETLPRLSRIGLMLHHSSVSSSSLERAFSFTTLMRSIRRHKLAASTILDIALGSTEINFEE